jgi:formylglycine-generating enzyme required for sulfatase activity
MKNSLIIIPIVLSSLVSFGSAAVTTSQDFGAFTMDFATVGDAGNLADTNTNVNRFGRGSVANEYRLGVNEVSEGMISAYNADGANALNLITQDSRGADKPATSVSWNEAARFVNWLNTSQGHQAAYRFTTTGGNASITLWDIGSAGAGFDAGNQFRNSLAQYWIPSEDEWYKAAYYTGSGSTYTLYATDSDTSPTAVAGGTAADSAVYGQSFGQGPADIDNAGSLSHYGTMAQSGNVWEWGESALDGGNDSAGESRVLRGGSWSNSSTGVAASNRGFGGPTNNLNVGFRVAASVPEPSALLLTGIGAFSLLARRRRG